MRRITVALFSMTAIAMLASYAMSQQPGESERGPGARRGPGDRGPGGPPPNPIAEALDADKNHEISKTEIENAATALKKLDRNKDGKLTEDELRPVGGPGGPGRGGPGDRGPGGRGRRGGQGGDSNDYLERLLSFDKNKDGKVSKDELPERMHGILERLDENKDGVLEKSELEKVAARFGQEDRGDRRPDGRRDRGGDRRDGRRGPGGPRDGREGRGPGGPPSPQRLVEHALTFDADKDGKLSKEELMKFAEEVARHRGPGGGPEGRGRPGGRDRQGGDGGRGRGDSDGRPQRPARPK